MGFIYMKAFDLSRYLFLLPEGVPKVGRDYCFCSLILWYILCGCELWADSSHCGLHCLGLVESVEVVREELPFPLF